MGSPVSPVVANLFMTQLEETALATFVSPPSMWLRFVDDISSVIRRDAAEALLCHLNAQHQAIQFTIEREEAETLPFMDIKVRRNGERLFHRNL